MLTAYHTSSYHSDNFQHNLYDQNTYQNFNQTNNSQLQQNFQTQNGYQMGQGPQGWSSVTLKEIMGHIDLLNTSNSTGCNWPSKWNIAKDVPDNNNVKTSLLNTKGGNYLNYLEKGMSLDTTMNQTMSFKNDNRMNCKQGQENEDGNAWLGPQLWNRKLLMDCKKNDHLNQVTFYFKIN
jgi:hypothetical protein